MNDSATESAVARTTDDPGGKGKVPRSVTLPPDVDERLNLLMARSGQDRTAIVVAALKRAFPAFEKDFGEMLREERQE